LLFLLAGAIVFAAMLISGSIQTTGQAQKTAQQQTTSAINSAALQSQLDAQTANNNAMLARSQAAHDATMQQWTEAQQARDAQLAQTLRLENP
jgi:hypothetical protein